MLWIIERNTDLRFGQVHDAVEAKCGLLAIIVADDARLCLVDRLLHLVDVAVKKIHLARRRLDPGAAIYPGAPSVVTRNGGRLNGHTFGHLPYGPDAERVFRPIIQANVHVRGRRLRAFGIGAT